MRIDVTNLIGPHARVAQRLLHYANRTRTAFIGHRQMESIGRHAVTDNLSINTRASPFGKFKLLEDHDPGAFTNNKTIAIAFKWP